MILCYGEKLSSGVRVRENTIVTRGSFRIGRWQSQKSSPAISLANCARTSRCT
jgi:hypothetical protein